MIPVTIHKDFPKVVPVFIEVSQASRMKYEWNKEYNILQLDRVLHSSVYYPHNYGFIPETLCGDGDPLDILVLGDSALVPGCVVMVRPICYMVMQDEKGMDEKVLGVIDKDPRYECIEKMEDINSHILKEISHFFETYKQLEKEKWVKIDSWKDIKETYELIKNTHSQFLLTHNK